jgi:hypothetical protein
MEFIQLPLSRWNSGFDFAHFIAEQRVIDAIGCGFEILDRDTREPRSCRCRTLRSKAGGGRPFHHHQRLFTFDTFVGELACWHAVVASTTSTMAPSSVAHGRSMTRSSSLIVKDSATLAPRHSTAGGAQTLHPTGLAQDPYGAALPCWTADHFPHHVHHALASWQSSAALLVLGCM